MAKVGRPGRLMKFIHGTGNTQFVVAMELHAMPGSFFNGGVDLISYVELRDGKIARRNDYYDMAELTPADIEFVHPGGVPRQSCLAGPVTESTRASREMVQFTRSFHRALSTGEVGRVVQAPGVGYPGGSTPEIAGLAEDLPAA